MQQCIVMQSLLLAINFKQFNREKICLAIFFFILKLFTIVQNYSFTCRLSCNPRSFKRKMKKKTIALFILLFSLFLDCNVKVLIWKAKGAKLILLLWNDSEDAFVEYVTSQLVCGKYWHAALPPNLNKSLKIYRSHCGVYAPSVARFMLIFCSISQCHERKNSNTLVFFSQTVRLSSYEGLSNCSRSFTLCWNVTLLAVYRILFTSQIQIKTRGQMNMFRFQ